MKTFFKFFLVIVIIVGIFVVIHFIPLNKGSADSSSASSDKAGTSTIVSNGIIINEVMSDNKGIYPDDRGNNSDWVEIYNSNDSDVNLQNYSFSDDAKNTTKWPFPNITLKAHGYIILFLSGDSQSDLQNGFIHCSFKLSSKGETLYMYDASRQLIDSVEVPSLEKNVSYGIQNGKWQVMNNPTPGFENSDAGAAAFKASRTVQNPAVLITEVMTKNRMTIKDAQGNYSDWIELMNISGKDVDLTGCGLSDDPNEPMKWKFPDEKIKTGGILTVFCNGNESVNDNTKEIDADFKLSSTSSTVIISDQKGYLIDSVQVSSLSTDWSYERTFINGAPTSTWQTTSQPSPGYPNTSDGFADFMKSNTLTPGDIVISEVLTSNNNSNIAQGYDYIEVENRGKSAVNLKGYGLTNNASNPAKFLFPDTAIQPGKQLVVLAAGQSNDKTKALKDLKTTFKLSRLGDNVSLFNANGQLLDRYFIGVMQQNYSVGRQEGQTAISYFNTPTPGQANGSGYAGIVQDVSFSQQAGKYDSAVKISLASTDGSDVYYTTNGDTPTKSSTKYAGAITVDKTMSIRAKAFKDGYIDSGTSTATYFIGAKHTLPIISIVTDGKLLFDPDTGIYELGPNSQLVTGSTTHYQVANYIKRGKDSERPASFEMFDNNGKQIFEQNIAVRIQGGFSRDNQQKSLSIFARSSVGPSTMKYKFFDDLPYTEYKSIQLRDGGQADLYGKINEAVILNLVKGKELKVLTQDIKPYVVYINGQYWGVYYMEEKRNQHFVTQHEGISDNSKINMLFGSGLSSGSPFVKNGTNSGYKALVNYVQTNDMSQKTNYDYVASQFDTDSYMDEMINEIYVANSDYANLEFYQIPSGKWKQIFYDFCWTLGLQSDGHPDHTTLAYRMSTTSNAAPYRYMFVGLLQYQPWKEAFFKRFAWTMENIYPTQRVLDEINKQANLIASEMPTERAKFTDSVRNWSKMVESMRTFAKERPYYMLQQLKCQFNLLGSQLRSYFDFSDSDLKKALNISDSQYSSIFG